MPGRGKTEEEEITAGKMGWEVGYWDPNSQRKEDSAGKKLWVWVS